MNVIASPAFKKGSSSYTFLLYSEMKRWGVTVHEFSPARLFRTKYDVVHIHWPERAFLHPNLVVGSLGSIGLLGVLQLIRRRGTRVVWTVHNLQAHEQRRPRLESFLWKLYTRTIDAYIAMTTGGETLARERFDVLTNRTGFVIPHGHYRNAFPNHVSCEEARAMLGIDPDATVVSFVGRIRSYKNVPRLVRVFRAAADDQGVLLVAGRVHSADLHAEVLDAAAGDPRVRLFLDFVPNDKVQYFLNAADLVVLPFTEILNSGSALLALSFDRPVLLPDKGAMGELQAEVGEEWVKTFRGEFDIDALRDGLAWALHADRAAAAPLDHFQWRRIARDTVRAYLAIQPQSNSFENVETLLADHPELDQT